MAIANAKQNVKIKSMVNLFVCLFAIILITFVLVFVFNLSDYAFGHDIRYHYEIIRALNDAWHSGGITRVIGLVGQDYGYGTGLFYSLIPAGIAVIIMNVFSISISNALSIELFLLLCTSGIVMFFFMRSVVNSRIISVLTACIYITSPYVLTDIYVRFAFSEMFLILAIPLIMWGLYFLVHTKDLRKFFLPFTIGYSLAIMTHLTVTVFFTVLVLIYLLIYIKDIFKFKLYIPLIISALCVLLITATYYIPMFINHSDVGLDNMSYTSTFLSFNGLWSFILVWLIFSSILNVFTIWVFIKYLSYNRGKISKEIKVLFTFLCLTFGLSTCFFPWFLLPNAVGILQYSWRMFIVNMPILAISIGYLMKNDAFKSHKFSLMLGVILCLVGSLSVAVNYNFLQKGKKSTTIYKQEVEQLINGKSENWGLGASKKGDYLPNGCSTDYLFNRANEKMVVQSDVKITEFANYQSLNQISFVISKQQGAFSVLNIPYNLVENVEIYQISDDNESNEYNIEKTNNDGLLGLNYEPCLSECKITLSYDENGELDNYLKQNPFEFIVESGDATFTNYVRSSATKYQVEIEVNSTASIELPTLYYVGYEITYISNGEEQIIVPTKNENGFISLTLNESGTLKVEFVGDYVGVSNNITILGVVLSVTLAIIVFVIPKKFTVLKRDTI